MGDDLTRIVAVLDGTRFTSGAGAAQTASGLLDLTGTDWEYKTFKLNSSEGLASLGFIRVYVDAQ